MYRFTNAKRNLAIPLFAREHYRIELYNANITIPKELEYARFELRLYLYKKFTKFNFTKNYHYTTKIIYKSDIKIMLLNRSYY